MLAKEMEEEEIDLNKPVGSANESPSTSTSTQADQSQTEISVMEGGNPDESVEETVTSADETDSEEENFCESDLTRLHEMIIRPRWVVPVLPDGELPKLLRASIKLLQRDPQTSVCDKFFDETLPICFQKIITDDAVKEWKFEIHKCILNCCELLLEVAVLIFDRANLAVLECLSIVLNPKVRFHQYNGNRCAESIPPGEMEVSAEFAKCDQTVPKGWLVDLINSFGRLGGFEKLLARFESDVPLNVTQLGAYVKPFGQCADFLIPRVIQQYFVKIVVRSMAILREMSDEELKKECSKGDGRENPASLVLKQLRNVIRSCPQLGYSQELDMLRLKIITRLLQVAPFGGKMNALNELSRILQNAQTYYNNDETDDYLTAEKLLEWIREGNLFAILLRENLHHVQYVERLEKVFRFVIKENGLTSADLDLLWGAQQGRHEMIVKNIHGLLAKLAWDFNANQLDHLFHCFQASWRDAGRKEKESLLDLMRKLAEDDKEGMMATKVLQLLWSLAHDAGLETEMVDLALCSHVKILDFSCAADKDAQKQRWLRDCIAELEGDTWAVPAMKQFREICNLYPEAPSGNHYNSQSLSTSHIGSHMPYRNDVMRHLQDQFSLVIRVSESLIHYVERAKSVVALSPQIDASQLCLDGRYNHNVQVKERLSFIKFLLTDGQMWLCEKQAKQIWECLVAKCIFLTDRDLTFRWFGKLMGDSPDLDPDMTRTFFEGNVLQLDPVHLTENGLRCFENFFKAVNIKEGNLVVNTRTGTLHIDSSNLLGDDYLWKIILTANDEVACLAIEFMKTIYSTPSGKLVSNIGELHSDFTQQCRERLKSCYDTLQCLVEQQSVKDSKNQVWQQTTRLCRTLKVLYEYVWAYDNGFDEERKFPPLYRLCWGYDIEFVIRILMANRGTEEFLLTGHSNQSLLLLRRQILKRIQQMAGAPPHNPVAKVEIQYNNEPLEPSIDDRKILADFGWRGKVLLTVRATVGGTAGGVSSPDASSSDSSPAETPHADKPPNSKSGLGLSDTLVDAEANLPGVLLAHKYNDFVSFIFKVKDLSSRMEFGSIVDVANAILHQLPASLTMVEKIRNVFLLAGSGPPLASAYTPLSDRSFPGEKGDGNRNRLDPIFFAASPSEVLYCLELTYCLLVPADLGAIYCAEEEVLRKSFFLNGGIETFLGMLVRNNFMPTPDVKSRFAALSWVLRILKLGLAVVYVAKQRQTSDTHTVEVLVKRMIPYDVQLRDVAVRTGHQLDPAQILHVAAEEQHAKVVMKLIWAAAGNQPLCCFQSFDEIHSHLIESWDSPAQPVSHFISDVLTGLDVLLIMSILSPDMVESLDADGVWTKLMFDLLFADQEEIRQAAEEHIVLVTTQPAEWNQKIRRVSGFLDALLQRLNTMAETRPCCQYFVTLARLLTYCRVTQIPVRNLDLLLDREIAWLNRVKEHTVEHMESFADEPILSGHLQLTKELVGFLSSERKFEIGSRQGGPNLIRDLIDDFVLPSSRMYADQRQLAQLPRSQTTDYTADIVHQKSSTRVPRSQTTIIGSGRCVPVCESAISSSAAYDLLVALVVDSLANLQVLVRSLVDMFYDEEVSQVTSEWEYIPPVGLRPANGFVGLKNGGATCYMNSVIQQLFMMTPVREGLLSIDCGQPHSEDDSDQEDSAKPILGPFMPLAEDVKPSPLSGKREYNLNILRTVQLIFGHLSGSQLQFYTPKRFWKLFRFFGGESINLREQHDAVEFMGCLMDSLDEAAKSLGQTAICQSVFGGVFADQKICRTCPHKYSRKEPFLYLNVDIRNANSLNDALTEYVRGELLEGGDAYMCETCNAKVDAVKRISIEKLPKILAIQLKRFDYDWERDQAVKFNDYFEFPRDLNMEPFTVHGLAKQGEPVVEEDTNDMSDQSCLYALSGIVVHSGQANGGHYYSYILHRCSDGVKRWYKFDDGEVSEANIDNEEDMRNQCFGGEHTGEVYDPMLKRMSVRRQKRWWNAYILFYERVESHDSDGLASHFNQMVISSRPKNVPRGVEKAVRLRNMRALHQRNQFSLEYFNFIKRLVSANIPLMRDSITRNGHLDRDLELIADLSMRLAVKFLFMTAFHAKKVVRSPCQEWSEVILCLVQYSFSARSYLAIQLTVIQRGWIGKYLLECPSAEVRLTFSRILLHLMQHSKRDSIGSVKPINDMYKINRRLSSVSDVVLHNVLLLLHLEVSDFGRHLQHFFNLFYQYATLGHAERSQLICMETIQMLMGCATDEGVGPAIRYQYPEFQRLYATVSLLVRSCELPVWRQRAGEAENHNSPPITPPNPFALRYDNCPQLPLPPAVVELLFDKNSYVKKILEDQQAVVMDDNMALLRFCCWENADFSKVLLMELLGRMSFAYAMEVRPIQDVLLMLIAINDSLQSWRIQKSLSGFGEVNPGEPSVTGLLECVLRNRQHFQKRAYQIIKKLTAMFSQLPLAKQILASNGEFKRKYNTAIIWLKEEYERERPYGSGAYGHGFTQQWTSQPASNETSTGFFLERTLSVRATLESANLLIREVFGDEEERVEVDGEEDMIPSTPSSKPSGHAPLTRTGSGVTLPLYRPNLDDSLQRIPEDPKPPSPPSKPPTTPVDSATFTHSDSESPVATELGPNTIIRQSKSADSGLANTSDESQTSANRPLGSVSFTSRLSESDGTLGGVPTLYPTVENLAELAGEQEKMDESTKENEDKD